MSKDTSSSTTLKLVGYYAKEGKLDEAAKAYLDGPYKKFKTLKGYKMIHFCVDRKNNRLLAYYFWESQELWLEAIKQSGAHVLQPLLEKPDNDHHGWWECVTPLE